MFKKLLFSVALAGSTAYARPIEADAELGAMFTNGGLTADIAAQRARVASPDVWRKVAELEAAVANVDVAKLQMLPRITNTLTYTRLSAMDEPNFAAAGGPGSFTQLRDQYSSQTKLVVPLSDYVLRFPSTTGAARRAADAARANAGATELAAAHAARLAYYEWIRAQLQLVISQRQLSQVRANVVQVRSTVDAGRLPKADLLRLESQEAEIEQLVDRLQTLATLREEILRVQIGARAGERLAIGEDVRTAVLAPPVAALDALTKQAATQRLDMRSVRFALEANAERREAEKANEWPSLVAFGTTEYANPNQRAFPPEDKWTFSWTAGVQLTFSFNDAMISRATQRKLSAEAKALKADREAVSNQIRIDVLTAQNDIANAQRAITTTAKGLDAAEESYRVRRALLAADRATAVELVDAETDLTRARISAIDARIDLRIAIAGLAHALGTDR